MSYALVFLILSSTASLSGPETVAAFEAAYPGGMLYVRDIEQGPNRSRIFDVRGRRILVGYTTDRLKAEDFPRTFENFESWPEGREALEGQAGHVVIGLDETVQGHEEFREGAEAVTLMAAALAAKLPVSAALIADSELVVDPRRLRARAASLAEGGHFPIDLWVSRQPFHLDDGKGTKVVITTGLRPFVGREIEIFSEAAGFNALGARAHNLGLYLIEKGPVIGDGETFGYSQTDRVRVRHVEKGLSGRPALSLFVEKAQAELPVP